MLPRAIVVLILIGRLLAQDKTPADLLKMPVSPGRRIAYGNEPLQFGDLRVPAGKGPHPVVVIVHGGCWMAKLGNLDERGVALDLLRPLAVAMTDAGFATWNVEYRRLGNTGDGWPGTFEDVAQGADHMRKSPARTGSISRVSWPSGIQPAFAVLQSSHSFSAVLPMSSPNAIARHLRSKCCLWEFDRCSSQAVC